RFIINAFPGGALGGITAPLYGMIGLIGASIWHDNHVNFGHPPSITPVAAALLAGVGDVTLEITQEFQLVCTALGTLVLLVPPHLVKHKQSDLEAGDTRLDETGQN